MVACARPEQERENELLGQEGEWDPSTTTLTGDEDGNDTTQPANSEWPIDEGYTPLSDMIGMENVMFAMPTPSIDDYDYDAVDERNGVLYSSRPISFVADPSAMFHNNAALAGHDYDEEEEKEDENANGSHFSEIDSIHENKDYENTASLALLALEEDYQVTLRGEVRPSLMNSQSQSTPAMPMFDPSYFALKDSDQQTQNFADFNVASDAEINSSPNNGNNELVTSPNNPQKNDTSQVDTDAVKKVVAGILNSEKFNDRLKKWQDERKELSRKRIENRQHSLIPAMPLKAFRKDTPKAIQATTNLTRSATMAEALQRLTALLQSQDCLSIHVVGADYIECESEDKIRTHFAPLARWIGGNIYSPRSLSLSLIGPNMPRSMATLTTYTNLLDPSQLHPTQRLLSASAKCYEESYHDWLEEQLQGEGGNLPDIVFCFNAGIWGYDEWRPTIRFLIDQKCKIPMIVTAYTLFEAEDDYDVIKEIFTASEGDLSTVETSQFKQGCIWEPEINTFGSKQKRETASAVQGREYRENSAWQAWRF